LIAVSIVAVALPALARAQARYQVTSSTQYLRYNDFQSDPDDQEDIAQYLRGSAAFGEKSNISVQGYGRLVGTLTASVEERNELTDDVTGRLYYLFLDYRDLLPNHLDLRAGRTFVPNAAVPGIVDGAEVVARNLGVEGLGATAFGGRRVFLDNKSELPFDDDWLTGASAFLETKRRTRIELAYARDYREGELARETTALDVLTTPATALSLLGRAKFDLVSEEFTELLAGAKITPVAPLVLDLELYQSRPTFDRFSFYRFFDVEDFRQARVGAEYTFGLPLRVFASYAYERFDSDEDANVVVAGFSARPITDLFLNASYEYRDGFGGELGGLRTSAGYTAKALRTTLLGGVDYDDFRREDSRDDTARRYWAGADVKVTKVVGVALRAQRTENFLFDAAYQGFAAVDVNL
jgi:hypothetical protein